MSRWSENEIREYALKRAAKAVRRGINSPRGKQGQHQREAAAFWSTVWAIRSGKIPAVFSWNGEGPEGD